MYAVSSGFIAAASQKNAAWKRKFTLAGSDYSSRVMKWPKVSNRWDDIKPGTVTIELSNDDRLFNFFLSSPASLKNSGLVQLGFDYDTGSSEYITLFQGTVDAVQMREGNCKITLADKFKQLSDRLIGDNSTPMNYTGSSYLVHDLAWYFCTSHGGLSAIQSTSNPDIDWAAFNSWTSVWSGENTRMKALVKGKKITDMLKRISEMTQSAIRVENNKVKFSRYTLSDSSAATLDQSTVMDADLLIDERAIINRVRASADYNVASDTYAITTTQTNTASVNSYSLKEEIVANDSIWFVDSVSALNISQRMLLQYANPYGKLSVQSALSGAMATIGDTVTFVDSFYGFNQPYRVMAETIDMNTGAKTYELDDTQIAASFRLDFSSLDSSDLLL